MREALQQPDSIEDIKNRYRAMLKELNDLARRLTPQEAEDIRKELGTERRVVAERLKDEKESLGVRKGGARARKLGWYK